MTILKQPFTSPTFSWLNPKKSQLIVFGLACLLALILLAPFAQHGISAESLKFLTAPREGRTMVYWTPHKTGSSSMRAWLKRVSEGNAIPIQIRSHYPYGNFTDWVARVEKFGDAVQPCGIIAGHIRIPPHGNQRIHEGTLGPVISTTRNAMDTLASKYFHRTGRKLEDNMPAMRTVSSSEARLWFFYFHDADPCEQLRYYDGIDGCERDEGALRQRAKRIAENIDCAVDTDDADEDINAICKKINARICPEYPRVNTKVATNGYEDLFRHKHLTRIMQPMLKVTNILRAELMKRRCRFLDDGSGIFIRKLGKPNWPSPDCTQHL